MEDCKRNIVYIDDKVTSSLTRLTYKVKNVSGVNHDGAFVEVLALKEKGTKRFLLLSQEDVYNWEIEVINR